MDGPQWLQVKLFLEAQIISGFVYHPQEDRLLDILSSISVRRLENRGKFLELSQVDIQHLDGKVENLSSAYINKATVHFAVTLDAESARGLGSRVGVKTYPYVEKQTLPVTLQTPAYMLTGSMHHASYQQAWQVLEEATTFLPLTGVDIQSLTSNTTYKAPFVAVNKDLIISLKKEG